LVKDRAYFGRDGGVTLSGGEALLQEGAIELLQLLKAEGIQTASTPAVCCFPSNCKRRFPYTDILLYDLKIMNDAEHTRWTGRGNAMILRNLGHRAIWAKGNGRLWIRTRSFLARQIRRTTFAPSENRINAIAAQSAGNSARLITLHG
jgi:pyruvate formate lyase activating enzyme